MRNILTLFKKKQTLKQTRIEDIFPDFGNSTIKVFHPATTPTGCRLIELILFGYLAGSLDDIHFFEIGTSEGRTTRNIAINLGEKGRLTSIDLAADQFSSMEQMPDYQKHESRLANAKFISDLPESIKTKIKLLHGDSTQYNFKEEVGEYDIVFVDGNHATEVVLKDAQTATQLLRRDGGIILFHDYLPDSMPTVVDAIHDLSKKHQMIWLEGTKLAVMFSGTPRIPVKPAVFGK